MAKEPRLDLRVLKRSSRSCTYCTARRSLRLRTTRSARLAMSGATFYRWCKEYGGMKTDQLKRLKELEKENEPLRRAVSDLTLDKLILKEAAKGNF